MCGIIGIIGRGEAPALLMEGLKRLEYRGYDSAGVATLVNGRIERRRAEGKLENLEALLAEDPIGGTIGIGHTRWATHGRPNEINAHPHATDKTAIVHNGIIENFQPLCTELEGLGHEFLTDTDSEVVAHLLTRYLDEGLDPVAATRATLARLEGAFALAIIFAGEHELMIGARRGSPLAVGFGEGEMYLGSDSLALAPLTQKICYLEEGDWAEITPSSVTIHDESGEVAKRQIQLTASTGAATGKGDFPHFMLKEIFEQPGVIGDTLYSLVNPQTRTIELPDIPFAWDGVPKVTLVACGTSSYAALVAKYWFEDIAGIAVEWDIASEFRYRAPHLPQGGVALFISQSGETADTLAALRFAREQGQHIVALVNVPESSIAREADLVLGTHAGPEIGVASTKAFTTQLTVLACLVIAAARAREAIGHEREAALSAALMEVPARVADVLNHDEKLRVIAKNVAKARDVIYLGRGASFPIALEGALKLKEISYIHAEGYAAGEMKHGPIALIEDDVPVIVIAPSDKLFEKTASNTQEVIARGGKVIFFSDAEGVKTFEGKAAEVVELPKVDPFVAPILYAIPVQLLAYHTAVAKRTNVDQPRNLAKSVTVE
ncbi:MAG: glutamine--fructose-6-phosphate transaminase (isomerizing) [Alphaproteobacteria bacterium]|jgi:glucosamine--fructose-6-phosphate aminotransferase (isomerizing)|nr:glutamine--fructose-6-phosphate transaminase (isomerizing) [Alphaproteobacteria bacterium]MDP7456749.1 glutamine--fructose-6-phosphate transaminase (isomerizing) [Alphaproteobacteria bacterium]HJO88796.1 glutamine--fructose-6-phosphate transaminase (isomerizing) [Alphaproteobacteria bacterium]